MKNEKEKFESRKKKERRNTSPHLASPRLATPRPTPAHASSPSLFFFPFKVASSVQGKGFGF
jgi:hypothetical protein